MNELQEYTPKELKFCELYAQSSFTNAEIAKKVEMGETTVYEWLRKPKIQAKIQEFATEYDKRLKHKIRSLADKAVKAWEDCLKCNSPETQRKTAEDIFNHLLGDPSKTSLTNITEITNTPIGEVLNDNTFELFAEAVGRAEGGNSKRIQNPPSNN